MDINKQYETIIENLQTHEEGFEVLAELTEKSGHYFSACVEKRDSSKQLSDLEKALEKHNISNVDAKEFSTYIIGYLFEKRER